MKLNEAMTYESQKMYNFYGLQSILNKIDLVDSLKFTGVNWYKKHDNPKFRATDGNIYESISLSATTWKRSAMLLKRGKEEFVRISVDSQPWISVITTHKITSALTPKSWAQRP